MPPSCRMGVASDTRQQAPTMELSRINEIPEEYHHACPAWEDGNVIPMSALERERCTVPVTSHKLERKSEIISPCF